MTTSEKTEHAARLAFIRERIEDAERRRVAAKETRGMSLEAYHDLIARKRVTFEARGLKHWGALPSSLFPHQTHGVEFALRQGCSAMFYDTGLGKSRMAHAYAQQIVEATNQPVLMLCPLAVGPQHAREAEQIGVDAKVIRSGAEMTGAGVYIINYDRLDKIDASRFAGVILDEFEHHQEFHRRDDTRSDFGFWTDAISPRLHGDACPERPYRTRPTFGVFGRHGFARDAIALVHRRSNADGEISDKKGSGSSVLGMGGVMGAVRLKAFRSWLFGRWL